MSDFWPRRQPRRISVAMAILFGLAAILNLIALFFAKELNAWQAVPAAAFAFAAGMAAADAVISRPPQ